MKPNSLPSLLFLAIASILLSTCQKPSRDNPWDELAGLDPESWAPGNLKIETPSITHRTISWEYSGDDRIEGFKIDRKHGNENWVESYAKLGKDMRSFSDTISPDQSTTYYYKVYAHAGNIKSYIMETSALAAFPAPTNLSLQKISDISYKLNWLDNSDGEAGFIIERKTTGPDFIVLDTTDANSISFTDPNVFIGKTPINVEYRVKAFHGKFYSDVALANTNASITAPSNFNIDRIDVTTASISWSNNSTDEISFSIERKHADGDWELIAIQSSTTFLDQTFQLNTDVFYRIAAYVGNYSSEFMTNNFNSQIPTPNDLTYTINSSTSITLNWNYPTSGHEGFQLERKTNNEAWSVIAPNINPEASSYTDVQINLDQNDYSYRLGAYANSFFSDKTSTAIFYTQTVTNPATGKTWMDRNLGASRVAQSSTDAEAYGDLYQWGRLTDDHQNRLSGTTSTLSSSDNPGHGNFILAPNSPYNWRNPQNPNLWQGVSGTNNPCPNGFRLPTMAEWNAELHSWSSNNAAGAFNSPLKLPVSGYRNGNNGSLGNVGSFGLFWSATVEGTNAFRLYINSDDSYMGSFSRASGLSVRCLKD